MSFFAELKRRNVFKVGVAYAIVAWLIMQVADTFFPALHLPDWTITFVAVLLILGFPLAVFLAWIYELTPEGIKITTSEGPDQYHTSTTGQRLNYFIIGVLVLVVSFLLVDDYVLKESSKIAGETAVSPSVTETVSPEKHIEAKHEQVAPPNSIAVLPFADMSPDKDQDYFVDGIAEELLNSLARIKDLEVRGRTSSFYFKDRNEDLHTISKMLNVKYILEGSVRKAGNQVRITVQMIDTQSDEHLWSKTYDRNLDDIFTIQEDIAQSVADNLQISLGVGELGRVQGMTRNVTAFEEFLTGRSLTRIPSRENISRAIEHLVQAVTLDQDFAVAWTFLADIYDGIGATWIPERAEEFAAKRDAARTHVIELIPEVDYALRIKAAQSGDRVEEERLFRQALALNPADYDTNIVYVMFLNRVGRPTAAFDFIQRAVRVEPLSATAHLTLGVTNELISKSMAAAEAFKRGRELADQPAVFNSALLTLALEDNNRGLIEDYVELILNTELLGSINRSETRDINQVMLELLDMPEAAGEELKKFTADPAYANIFNRSAITVWASYFGEHTLALQLYLEENTLRWLKTGQIGWPIWRPIHKPMRRLPGFKELVTKLGLVNYWRATGNWGDFCHPVGEDDFECN